MDEKYVWRVGFVVTLLLGVVFAQLDNETKSDIINDLAAIVGRVDTAKVSTLDDQTKIAKTSLTFMENDLRMSPYRKCIQECGQLLETTTTTTIKCANPCTWEGGLCCADGLKCDQALGCV